MAFFSCQHAVAEPDLPAFGPVSAGLHRSEARAEPPAAAAALLLLLPLLTGPAELPAAAPAGCPVCEGLAGVGLLADFAACNRSKPSAAIIPLILWASRLPFDFASHSHHTGWACVPVLASLLQKPSWLPAQLQQALGPQHLPLLHSTRLHQRTNRRRSHQHSCSPFQPLLLFHSNVLIASCDQAFSYSSLIGDASAIRHLQTVIVQQPDNALSWY